MTECRLLRQMKAGKGGDEGAGASAGFDDDDSDDDDDDMPPLEGAPAAEVE